jgi:hypothetical protein
MKTQTFLLAACAASLLSGPSASAAFLILQNDPNTVTFTFDPPQSAPLPTGFASYTSGAFSSGNTFRGLAWSGTTGGLLGANVVSNTLIDASGNPVPDSRVDNFLVEDFNLPRTVTGFGYFGGSGFTVAGGALTLSTGPDVNIPTSTISGFAWGTSYDPGTTGVNGDLIPVPEPSTTAALAGLAALGFVMLRRRVR